MENFQMKLGHRYKKAGDPWFKGIKSKIHKVVIQLQTRVLVFVSRKVLLY